MKLTKSPPELIDLFNKVAPTEAGVETRKMFGYPSLFVNGHLFSGLHANSMILRLPESDRSDLLELGGKPFEPMPGRPMKEYVVIPEALLKKPAALRSWINKSLNYARTLPPKPPKQKTTRKQK